MDKAEQSKPKRVEAPWMKVIAIWLHHYLRWKNRLDRLEEKSEQEPKVTARITGMPSGGGTTGDSTLDTAQARMEGAEQLYDLREKVRIIDLGLAAMHDEERQLIDLVYFRGVPREADPWVALGKCRTIYFEIRQNAFKTIYYIGWEDIDIEAQKRRKADDSRTNSGQQVAKAVVQ